MKDFFKKFEVECSCRTCHFLELFSTEKKYWKKKTVQLYTTLKGISVKIRNMTNVPLPKLSLNIHLVTRAIKWELCPYLKEKLHRTFFSSLFISLVSTFKNLFTPLAKFKPSGLWLNCWGLYYIFPFKDSHLICIWFCSQVYTFISLHFRFGWFQFSEKFPLYHDFYLLEFLFLIHLSVG